MTTVALDLDDEVLNHLADPKSVLILRTEGVTQELIEDKDVAEAFTWQMDHMRKHTLPATKSVLEAEFDYEICDPQTVVYDLIERLRERYGRNQSRTIVTELAERVARDPSSLATEMVNEGRRLSKLLDPKGESFGPQDLERLRNLYNEDLLKGRGASFGFDELDEHFYGQRGLTFMVGAPKAMKSWFTIKAMMKNAVDGRVPYLYSLELPARDAEMRLICMTAGVPFWKYIKHSLNERDWKRMNEARDCLPDFRIEKPPRGQRGIDQLIGRARDYGSDIIFVDQLQYVELRGRTLGARNDPGEYWEAINDFNDYTDDGPIWVVHQFNRSVMGADKMPDFQQIKGSSGIEECATLCLGLWSSKEMRKSGLINLETMVSRHIPFGGWECQVNFKDDNHIKITEELE